MEMLKPGLKKAMFHKILLAYFYCFGLFWALGLDQLFFVVFCLVGFLAIITSPKNYPSREAFFFGLFVLVSFISILQISSPLRYVTYSRNEGVYIAMLFIFLSSALISAKNIRLTSKLYSALLIFSLQCSVNAFLASNGIGISFKTLTAYILPDLGSEYLRAMMNKSTIQAEARWFAQGFYRPRGLMMYPNTMAGILASSLAIKVYFARRYLFRDRLFLVAIICAAIVMDVFSIYSSLSRSAWIGLSVALLLFPFVFQTSAMTKISTIGMSFVLLGFVFVSGLSDGIQARLFDKTHSNEGRGLNYQLIWEETTSSLDKLLFGHGTQVDHWLLNIPLGSHSTYLGIFFKYGVIGSICFLLFLFFLYRQSRALTKRVNVMNRAGGQFSRPYFLCFALIVPVVQIMFIEVDVDLSYAMYFSVLVFLVSQESHAFSRKKLLQRVREISAIRLQHKQAVVANS